ncbi:MAG TPA: amidase [Thermomicrobiales bacterium]|nr:amidase [Thermomicrobiales bacterium]
MLANDQRSRDGHDPFASATRLAEALARREISSRELLDSYLGRVDRHNPALNAVVTIDAERARAEADAADAAIARGEAIGPLHGLPVTIKDSLATAGLRTTSGAGEFAEYVPDTDAVVVDRLRRAGAIVFGKTNLPTFAGDAQTYNDLFGTTNNPWDIERTPGGSSGGSTAAIAAGLSALELGSDIGGSLRIPAHYCGVYTLKPTHGIVPERGHIPPLPGSLSETDVMAIGPLARDARDLDLCLSVIAGPDVDRAVGWRLELPPPRHDALADYRIAVWLDDPYCTIDGELAEVYATLVDELRRAGARISEVPPPVPLADAHDVAQRLIQGAMSRWLPGDAFESLLARAAAAPAGDDTPPLRWARNITQRVRDHQLAAERRLQMKAAWAAFFRDFDVFLCPVTPTAAIHHDQNPDVDARVIVVNGVPRPYGDQFAWLQSIGVVHLPAAVAPVGLTSTGLPTGIQIVAPNLEDRTAIDIAQRIASVMGGFRAPPGFD